MIKKISVVFLSALHCIVAMSIELNVLAEGIVSDTSKIQTDQIQQLINRCEQAGGGKIVFPGGNYKTGGLILKSNITFRVEAGATIIASRDSNDYKKTQNNSGDIIPCLIYAKDAQNISIEGNGVIDGRATHYWGDLDMVDGFIKDITENARKAGVPMKRYFHYKPYTCMVYLENCKFVNIRDVILKSSQLWTLHARWSDFMTISGVKIFSDLEKGINADGIDIDGCRNVTISDCMVQTGDDAIVLKTTALHGESRSCQNITVNNCILETSSTAIKLGTESHADFRFISFSNCIIRNSNRGISIVIRDGATAEDIAFSNIQIECTRRHFNWWGNADPIWLVVLKRRPESPIGGIKNITFNNITAHGMGTSKLEGFEGKPLENIRMNNVHFFMHAENYIDKRADDAFRATNVNDLCLTDVSVKWDTAAVEPLWRNAFTLQKVNNAILNRLLGTEAPTGKGSFVELKNTQNIRVENCLPALGTKSFLKYDKKAKRNIMGMNNTWKAVK